MFSLKKDSVTPRSCSIEVTISVEGTSKSVMRYRPRNIYLYDKP